MLLSKLTSPMLIMDAASSMLSGDVLFPFAFDEVYCRKVGRDFPPILHLWRHPHALVMGLRDRRLPRAAEAMDRLRAEGCSIGVRNSGGSVVPLDRGIVNMSLILPKGNTNANFQDAFELMYDLVSESLQPKQGQNAASISRGQVKGAYCPGEYDLSIKGKKFCGIAQRRQLYAYAVQAFVIVEGNGNERASLVREFYRLASASEGGHKADYPQVDSMSMASLSELLGEISADLFVQGVKEALQANGVRMEELGVEKLRLADIESMIDQLRDRYDK